MIARQGIFVEYSVFGEKTTVDWTVISDAKELEVMQNAIQRRDRDNLTGSRGSFGAVHVSDCHFYDRAGPSSYARHCHTSVC